MWQNPRFKKTFCWVTLQWAVAPPVKIFKPAYGCELFATGSLVWSFDWFVEEMSARASFSPTWPLLEKCGYCPIGPCVCRSTGCPLVRKPAGIAERCIPSVLVLLELATSSGNWVTCLVIHQHIRYYSRLAVSDLSVFAGIWQLSIFAW